MAYGRHAQGKGRHRAPARPPLVWRLLVLALVVTGLVVALPVVMGLALCLGIVFGWMNRAITKL
jgi:hypothetical protein